MVKLPAPLSTSTASTSSATLEEVEEPWVHPHITRRPIKSSEMPSQGRWYHFVIAGLYALFLPFFFCVWSCLRCCPHCWEVVIYRGYRALTCNEDDDLQTTAVRTSIPAISIRRQDPTIHDYFEELLRFELATTMTVTDQDLIITTAELESLNPASPKGGGICGGARGHGSAAGNRRQELRRCTDG